MDRWWIGGYSGGDRKQYFVFLLEIVSGSALYKTKGIEKNVLDYRMVCGFFSVCNSHTKMDILAMRSLAETVL